MLIDTPPIPRHKKHTRHKNKPQTSKHPAPDGEAVVAVRQSRQAHSVRHGLEISAVQAGLERTPTRQDARRLRRVSRGKSRCGHRGRVVVPFSTGGGGTSTATISQRQRGRGGGGRGRGRGRGRGGGRRRRVRGGRVTRYYRLLLLPVDAV